MAKRILIILTLLAFTVLPLRFALTSTSQKSLSEVAQEYVDSAISTLGTQNAVTAVVVSFRGLDTLGEVLVLFVAAAGVGFLLRRRKNVQGPDAAEDSQGPSEILQTGTMLLVPLILLFGVYIFVHGHLTPGGGFQGGVIIASAMLLIILAQVTDHFNHSLLALIESLSGLTYVILGIIGLLLGVGFLNTTWLPLGRAGSLFSGGAVAIIYSFIGLKVGAELTGVLLALKGQDT